MMLRNGPSLQVTDGRALPRKREDIRGWGWNIVSIGTDLADKRMEGATCIHGDVRVCDCARTCVAMLRIRAVGAEASLMWCWLLRAMIQRGPEFVYFEWHTISNIPVSKDACLCLASIGSCWMGEVLVLSGGGGGCFVRLEVRQ